MGGSLSVACRKYVILYNRPVVAGAASVSGLPNRSLTPPLGEHCRADEYRYTGGHTQRVNLDGMARDTQHAMGQIGDSQSKERSTDKGSTAEGEIFHQLNMPLDQRENWEVRWQ
jgi:hypothetical protein